MNIISRFKKPQSQPSTENSCMPTCSQSERNLEFVRQCYQELLQREADPDGLQNYTQRLNDGLIDHLDVLNSLKKSVEYLELHAPYNHVSDPLIHKFLSEFDPSLIESLRSCQNISQSQYESLWKNIFNTKRQLIEGQAEYGIQHKQRFFELCNAILLLTSQSTSPKIIEFGASEFSALYHKLRKGIILDCADRPTEPDHIGFTASKSLKISGAQSYISVDLNLPLTLLEDQHRHLHGQYDLVLFTEVIEHLIANPVEILKQLLILIKANGYIYLSTPNFFRKANLEKISDKINPQAIYPAGDDNWDAHHHHREYCLSEMLGFISQAGGQTKAFYFSDCWDNDTQLTEPEFSNMVFVIQKSLAADKT